MRERCKPGPRHHRRLQISEEAYFAFSFERRDEIHYNRPKAARVLYAALVRHL
jgi:hypothetical protein